MIINIDPNTGELRGYFKPREGYIQIDFKGDISSFVKPKGGKINGEWAIVETATPEEIEEHIKQQQLEQIKQFRQKTKQDGENFYNEVDVLVTAELFGKPADIVNPAVAEIDEKIMPVMMLVKDGQWYSALIKILNTEIPTNSIALDVWNNVTSYVQNYVNTHYRDSQSSARPVAAKKQKEVKTAVIKKHIKTIRPCCYYFIKFVNWLCKKLKL